MWFLEVVASMFFVDLLSGIVHMYLDYQVIEDETLKNHVEKNIPAIIQFETTPTFVNASSWDQFLWDFQIHHQVPYPSAVSEGELMMQIARPVFVPYVASVCAYAGGYVDGPCTRIWLMALTLSPFVQFTHFASHKRMQGKMTGIYAVVGWLQDAGVLLSASAHKSHHETYDRNFCIFNGWANVIVNPLSRMYANYLEKKLMWLNAQW